MAFTLIAYVVWNFMQKYEVAEERNSTVVGGICGFFPDFSAQPFPSPVRHLPYIFYIRAGNSKKPLGL